MASLNKNGKQAFPCGQAAGVGRAGAALSAASPVPANLVQAPLLAGSSSRPHPRGQLWEGFLKAAIAPGLRHPSDLKEGKGGVTDSVG